LALCGYLLANVQIRFFNDVATGEPTGREGNNANRDYADAAFWEGTVRIRFAVHRQNPFLGTGLDEIQQANRLGLAVHNVSRLMVRGRAFGIRA